MAHRPKKLKARFKFDKVAELNRMLDAGEQGAGKAKRLMSDTWTKRQSNNVTGMFNRKHSKPGACVTL